MAKGKSLGEIGYEAYHAAYAASLGEQPSGDRPAWDELPPPMRAAWEAAANAIVTAEGWTLHR